MPAEDNKQIVRKIEEAWAANDIDALDQHFAPDLHSHSASPMLPPGLAGAKMAHAASLQSFPDRHMIEGLYGEGDLVAVRTRFRATNQGGFPAFGVAPTGIPSTSCRSASTASRAARSWSTGGRTTS